MKMISLFVSVLLTSVMAFAAPKPEIRNPKTPAQVMENIKIRLENLGIQRDFTGLELLSKADNKMFESVKKFHEALAKPEVKRNLEDANLKAPLHEILEKVDGAILMAKNLSATSGTGATQLGPNGQTVLELMKASVGMAREALEGGTTVRVETSILNIARTLGTITEAQLKNEVDAMTIIQKVEAELNGYKIKDFIDNCNK